jgi:hypothetical protein
VTTPRNQDPDASRLVSFPVARRQREIAEQELARTPGIELIVEPGWLAIRLRPIKDPPAPSNNETDNGDPATNPRMS